MKNDTQTTQNDTSDTSVTSDTYQQKKKIIVVSSGGCGSWCLVRYFRSIGYEATHIHSRYPPSKLRYGSDQEKFSDRVVKEDDMENIKVIYIFRENIEKSIYSRFVERNWKQHLKHIECFHPDASFENLLSKKVDLFGLENFFDNWTTSSPERNYKIYCIKYETLFDNIVEIMNIIGNNSHKNVKKIAKIETERNDVDKHTEDIREIYKTFIKKMMKMPFIKIV